MKLASIHLTAGAVALGTILACAPRSEAPAQPATLGGEGASALPFIEDDYAAALSRAREAKLPLFVEVWAPW